ncbi:hypothetical protein BDC45DRAFT_539987 [Circinella umbellata]|nr:hypothetical protein BDC45DRAFT_539987 [Circinella umbellata]
MIFFILMIIIPHVFKSLVHIEMLFLAFLLLMVEDKITVQLLLFLIKTINFEANGTVEEMETIFSTKSVLRKNQLIEPEITIATFLIHCQVKSPILNEFNFYFFQRIRVKLNIRITLMPVRSSVESFQCHLSVFLVSLDGSTINMAVQGQYHNSI